MINLLNKIVQKIRNLKEIREAHRFIPPGHFYSPIPSQDEIKKNEERIFEIPDNVPGINLNEEVQLQVLNELSIYYKEMPFQRQKTGSMRYYFENEYYSYSDAVILYSMIRYLSPERIVEVGSGHSSCVILDTNEIFFDNSIECTFIEPFPEALFSLIKETDRKRNKFIAHKIQEVDINEFSLLKSGDILFIDSSHVSKINSDVNHIFFTILPQINSGVYIHFHDIFYPFEYPKEWVYEGRMWNESYLLHAFLQYNDLFEIVFFNSYLEHFYKNRFMKDMPLCLENTGASIWIRKK